MISFVSPLIFSVPLCCGCGATGDRAAGEAAQLKQRLDEKDAKVETLESEKHANYEKLKKDYAAAVEEKSRLQQQLAAKTGAEGLRIE